MSPLMLLLEHRSQRKPYSIRTEGFNCRQVPKPILRLSSADVSGVWYSGGNLFFFFFFFFYSVLKERGEERTGEWQVTFYFPLGAQILVLKNCMPEKFGISLFYLKKRSIIESFWYFAQKLLFNAIVDSLQVLGFL